MTGIIKFGVKAGLIGGAVYYSNEMGVWQDAETATKLYQKLRQDLNQQINPLVKDVQTNVSFEVPEIPSITQMSEYASSSWNSGVLHTFNFLVNLPSTLKQLSSDASSFINQQLEASNNAPSEANK